MKHLAISILVSFACLFSNAHNRYPDAPAGGWHGACERTAKNRNVMLNSTLGQYVGQIDKKGVLSGFGRYLDNADKQLIGFFENGVLTYGMTFAGNSLIVGSNECFCCYDIITNTLEYKKEKDMITKAGEVQACGDVENADGTRYIGEMSHGKRHGMGLLYYPDGDFWWGEFCDGQRKGYGVLFKVNMDIHIGYWSGDKVLKLNKLKIKKSVSYQ